MLHVSEMLDIQERVVVLDRMEQKMVNSGFKLPQIRRILMGGLCRYEKLLRWSKLDGERHRLLHRDAGSSQGKGVAERSS